jgi:hypothetical protein
VNRAIANAPAGQANLPKTSSDMGSSSVRPDEQAWRREIERAQASAWLNLPVVGRGGEGLLSHASQRPSPLVGAGPKPASAPHNGDDQRTQSPHQRPSQPGAAAAPPQDYGSSQTASRVPDQNQAPVVYTRATADVPQGVQRQPSTGAAVESGDIDDCVPPKPVAAPALHATIPGPASRGAVQAQRPQADEDSATALEAAVRTKEAWASPAGDRSPVRLSLALQGNVARLWLGIDEHVRPHLSQIISTTINDLNAKGITVDRLVCNGEVITGARIASGHRQPAEPPPHLSHLERGEP